MIAFTRSEDIPFIDTYCFDGTSASQIGGSDVETTSRAGWTGRGQGWEWVVTNKEIGGALRFVAYSAPADYRTKTIYWSVYSERTVENFSEDIWEAPEGWDVLRKYVSSDGVSWSSEGDGDAYMEDESSYHETQGSWGNTQPWIVLDEPMMSGGDVEEE